MSRRGFCKHCSCSFERLKNPGQFYCSKTDCQLARKREWRRNREIQAYYTNYLSSNRQIRQKMQDEPQHFFKAHALHMKSETVPLDKLAPEEAWESILTLCLSKLKQLEHPPN